MGLPTFFNRKIFPTLLKKPLHSLLFVNLEKITNGNEDNCQPFVGESRKLPDSTKSFKLQEGNA